MLDATVLTQAIVEQTKLVWGAAVFPREFVDKLAQGAATAIVDHVKQASLAVSGSTEGEGMNRVRSGSGTVLALNASLVVAFSADMPDTNYRIEVTPTADPGSYWWVTKSTTGFTLTLGAALGASPMTFDWVAFYPTGARGQVTGTGTIT